MLVWWSHQFLSVFLDNDHWPQAKRLSANDKDDNKVKPGAVHRSPRIYLKYVGGKNEKPQLEDNPSRYTLNKINQ